MQWSIVNSHVMTHVCLSKVFFIVLWEYLVALLKHTERNGKKIIIAITYFSLLIG